MHPGGGCEPRDSRVLVFSRRGLARNTWHASQYEFEDLVLELDDACLLAPAPQSHPSARSMGGEVLNTVLRGTGTRRRTPGWPAPAMTPTTVTTRHDVFFAVFHHPNELAYLNRLKGWRESARTRVCVLIELWKPWVERDADYLEVLRHFDHVYLFNPSVGPVLAAGTGIPTPGHLPIGVDALAMCPVPGAPARVIDVYTYGRRSPGVHAELLDLVERDGLTYLYDTLGNAAFRDHREHRRLLANMMKRSRFFLTHSINDSPDRRDRTGGEDEAVSSRYFEGVAGGAVLLGSRPRSQEFSDAFPWPDVVLPLAYDGSDTASVLAELLAQPERLAQIGAENVRQTLLRHDWAYRWQTVLRDLGLQPGDPLTTRLGCLAQRAALVTAEGITGAGAAGAGRSPGSGTRDG